MKLSEVRLEQVHANNRALIDRILFEGMADDGADGDVALVFGSKKAARYRVPVAVQLYQANRTGKLLMTGGKLDVPEARQMADRAMELGIPAEHIYLETSANNTTENVTESMKLLERQIGLDQLKRILVVTTHYHMRRCWLTLKTHMPQHIGYSFCPANDLTTRRDNWWMNEEGAERVLREVKALIGYAKQGIITDYEWDSRKTT
jgi:uncharacterized SAM-binding protein YcdF (DUF218 family)